jgi:hypothetical protein
MATNEKGQLAMLVSVPLILVARKVDKLEEVALGNPAQSKRLKALSLLKQRT